MRQHFRIRWLLPAAAGLVWATALPGQTGELAPAPDVQQLIAQLGSDDYHLRESAESALADLGYAAYDALTAAEQSADPEIASRARYLLRQITVVWDRPEDPDAVRRLFEGYDDLGIDERLIRARQLSLLPTDLGLAGLVRIVRFDRSELVAKRAAALVCGRRSPDAARVEIIERERGPGARQASQWLAAYCLEASDLSRAANRWGDVAVEERRLAEQHAEPTAGEMLAWLERRHANLLRRAERRDEARQVIARIIDREPGDPESLEQLVDWLIAEEAWSSIDDVARRFNDLFETAPMLIYSLAQARSVEGRSDEAEALAAKAAAILPEQIDLHAQTAGRLRLRGQTRWAEQEYRQVIDRAPAGSFACLAAQRLLADMLYDLLDFGRAADLLDSSVTAMRENVRQRRENENGGPVEEVEARALYYRAEQKSEQGDVPGRRELLERALALNPLDIDVLIALANVKELPPETRGLVAQRIEQAAQAFRAEQSQSPHDPTPYNQLAWLLANTAGDLDEALDGSRRSLELQPDEPAYLDTLGRVYYARGDLDAAVEQQSRAVEANPHSGLMRRQLELFRGALEKRRAEQPTVE